MLLHQDEKNRYYITMYISWIYNYVNYVNYWCRLMQNIHTNLNYYKSEGDTEGRTSRRTYVGLLSLSIIGKLFKVERFQRRQLLVILLMICSRIGIGLCMSICSLWNCCSSFWVCICCYNCSWVAGVFLGRKNNCLWESSCTLREAIWWTKNKCTGKFAQCQIRMGVSGSLISVQLFSLVIDLCRVLGSCCELVDICCACITSKLFLPLVFI